MATRYANCLTQSLFVILLCVAAPSYARMDGQDYSIRRYDMMIEPDFLSKKISLNVTIDISNPSFLDTFEFGLSDHYTSVSVFADSSPITFERGEGGIAVKVAHPEAHLTLRFRLAGLPGRSVDENRSVIEDSSLFLLWSDRFYPIDFDRWAPVTIALLLPPGFQAIAPGRLVKTEPRSGKVLHVFEATRPTMAFSVFADSRWQEAESKVNGIRMRTLLYPESVRFKEQIVASSADVLRFYSDALCPYPYDEFSFVEIDSIFARRAFPGFVAYSPRHLEKEFSSTGYDAHETALLWWGYTTRGSGPGSFQWTEGFGDYSEIMYIREKGKPLSRTFQLFRDEYLNTPAASDLIYTDLQGNTPQKLIHGKYPWLMHILRYVIGDRAFARGIHLLFSRYRYKTFAMDEFISTLEEGTGQSLRWWRVEWLERRGVPDILVTCRTAKLDSAYVVKCTLHQRGNIYHFPLEIAIDSQSGEHVETVHLTGEDQTIALKSAAPPTGIRLDPNGWILMRSTVAGLNGE